MNTYTNAMLVTLLVAGGVALPAGDSFDDADSNGDEVITFEEISAIIPGISRMVFFEIDSNGDGVIDETEFDVGVDLGLIRPK